MDEARFQEAKQSYEAGDYRAAAKTFLAAAGSQPEGSGAAFHMAGNSLLRLRRHADAVTVYTQALRDEIYDRRGAVRANLAASYVALCEYPEAVEAYSAALEEPDYTTRYKALQGMAGALFEMGKHTEAASAYRQAALDGDNPDPGKALNNLGLCFMAMQRPGDAIEAYKAALGFDTYEGRGKALANLGMAFFALGEHNDAAKSFEKAVQLHGYTLSSSARDAFERSRAALEVPGERVIVDGWSTGELPPVLDEPGSPQDSRIPGASAVGGMATATAGDPSTTGELFADQPAMDSAFFTVTEDEMREQDRAARRVERQERIAQRNPWTLVATVVLVVVVIAAAFAAAYFSGLGFPTQSMTVTGMLEARAEGEPVEEFWVAVPAADIDKEMGKIPGLAEFEIESIARGPKTSHAVVSITPENGTPMRYGVTLVREGVGWKVTGIEWPLSEEAPQE